MPIRVAVHGAQGKMGRLSVETLALDPRFELVGQWGRGDSLAACLRQIHPDVCLDFTRADVVFEHAQLMIEHHVRPVIGTSGLSDEQIKTLQHRCEEHHLGGLVVPNFSIGVLLMMDFAKRAAAYLSDVEIIEMHHAEKFDSPSGTAVKTAHEIAQSRQASPSARDNDAHASRGLMVKGVPIHSLRLPGILAKQSVIFGSTGETLTLTHESIDRKAFMPGVALACAQVMQLSQLYYGLEHVLEGWSV